MKITDRMARSYQGKAQDRMIIIRDSILKGFALKVSKKGSVSFCTEARIRGKGGSAKRVTIGTFPAFSVSQAREIASENLRLMQLGEDPCKVRKAMIDTEAEADSWTLGKVFTEYLQRRDLKNSTRRDYDYTINQVYGDWLGIPIKQISRKTVEDRFYEQKQKSKSTAAKSSKILSALLSYAKGIELSNGERLITENPCEVFRDKRVDRHIPRRETVISPKELSNILGTLEGNIRHEERTRHSRLLLMAIYVIALTGCRRREILDLKKKDVHKDHFILRDTKNHQDHVVPITTEIEWVITLAKKYSPNSPWLFPSIKDPSKPINNSTPAVKNYLMGYTLHDCRRTFITVASELGIDTGSIKKLVGHKDNGNVTEGYIIHRTEQRLPRLHKLFTMIQKEMVSHSPTDEELFGHPDPRKA